MEERVFVIAYLSGSPRLWAADLAPFTKDSGKPPNWSSVI